MASAGYVDGLSRIPARLQRRWTSPERVAEWREGRYGPTMVTALGDGPIRRQQLPETSNPPHQDRILQLAQVHRGPAVPSTPRIRLTTTGLLRSETSDLRGNGCGAPSQRRHRRILGSVPETVRSRWLCAMGPRHSEELARGFGRKGRRGWGRPRPAPHAG